ncbi:hypothetical protein BGZ65_004301 [Modicella reniformis]|uniref:HTH CENPB-type domain-containing protein n=1 Tax=Modicella reniformis TaxID=1440133 RepID=A0A9P6ILC5_9FUNG|nr:hypothetical protein BGZ65_004301 [Modicella reniformis]
MDYRQQQSIQPDIELNNEQDIQESSLSPVIESPAPKPRRYNRHETKRTRKPLRLQERLEIVAYWEENQHKPMAEISQELTVPRSTVYGIIKDRDNLKKLANGPPHAGLSPERYSTIESRFRILEELLVAWLLDQGSRGVSVASRKITAQAFEIHRMLSDLLMDPLPPCTFSSGWHQKFWKRPSGSFETVQGADSTTDVNDSWVDPDLIKSIFRPGVDDIYTSGVASMYLNMLPREYTMVLVRIHLPAV